MALNIVHAVEFSRNGRTRHTHPQTGPHTGAITRPHPAIPTGTHPNASNRKKTSSPSGIIVPLEEDELDASQQFRSSAPVGQRVITLREIPTPTQIQPASRACRTPTPRKHTKPRPPSRRKTRRPNAGRGTPPPRATAAPRALLHREHSSTSSHCCTASTPAPRAHSSSSGPSLQEHTREGLPPTTQLHDPAGYDAERKRHPVQQREKAAPEGRPVSRLRCVHVLAPLHMAPAAACVRVHVRVLNQREPPNLGRLSSKLCPAVSYSPTGSPLQYHRRCES